MKAFFVKNLYKSIDRNQSIYRLEPAHKEICFVLVSAVDMTDAEPVKGEEKQTAIYGCDASGEVTDYRELTLINEMNHAKALKALGYTLEFEH